MKGAILTSNSEKDLQLLVELAEKLGIKATVLSADEMEDIGLVEAIKKGRTGKFVDTDKFLKSLK